MKREHLNQFVLALNMSYDIEDMENRKWFSGSAEAIATAIIKVGLKFFDKKFTFKFKNTN